MSLNSVQSFVVDDTCNGPPIKNGLNIKQCVLAPAVPYLYLFTVRYSFIVCFFHFRGVKINLSDFFVLTRYFLLFSS